MADCAKRSSSSYHRGRVPSDCRRAPPCPRHRDDSGEPGAEPDIAVSPKWRTFRCQRCGSNMIGFRTSSGEYYVCGSQPYRKGMGCGPGVYVPRRAVEAEVCQGLGQLLSLCADTEGFTRQVNAEL